MKLRSLRQRPLALALHLAIAIGTPAIAYADQLIAIGGPKSGTEVDGKTFDTGMEIDSAGVAVYAGDGGSITGTNVVARSGGDAVLTVVAGDLGLIELENSNIVASGATGIGATSFTGGSLTLRNTNVTTTGTDAVAVAAFGGDVAIDGGTVRSTQGPALLSMGPGSRIISKNAKIVGNADGQSVVSSVDGGQIALSGGSIEANGNNYASALMATGEGSRVDAENLMIDVFGTGETDPVAIAVASSGGHIALNGANATAAGSNVIGLWSEGAGSQVDVLGTTITLDGPNSGGGLARNAGALSLTGTSITTHGAVGTGLQSFESARIEAVDTDVSTSGSSATGLRADTTGAINFVRGSVATTGDYSYGAESTDEGDLTLVETTVTTSGKLSDAVRVGENSIVIARDVTLHTSNEDAYGVYAFDGGSASLDDASIDTKGEFAYGVSAVDPASHVSIGGGSVTTSGRTANGIDAYLGGTVTANNVAVTTHGESSFAMFAFGAGSRIDAEGVTVVTDGKRADGAMANTGGQVHLLNSSVTTSGELAAGIVAVGADSLVEGDNVKVAVSGAGDVTGAAAVSGGTVRISNGSRIESTGVSPFSHAVSAITNDANMPGATFEATDSTLISAHGLGVAVNGGATARLTNTTVEAGRNAVGFEAPPAPFDRPSTISISGGSLHSAEATVGAVSGGGTVTLSNGVQISSDNGVLAQVNPSAALTLNIDSVRAAGDLVASPGGALDFNLTRGSSLTGQASNAGHGTIDATSLWTLTGNSGIASMRNDGTIAFAAPTGGGFKQFEVNGNYVANAGHLMVNTALGGDTSATDKLVVHGDTAGTTTVVVKNAGGKGALTSNGIEVVQVDGVSNGTFALGGRVVAGAYEYRLAQGAVATPADSNWYLRSEASVVPDPVTPDPTVPTDEVPAEPAADPVTPVGPTPVSPLYRPEPAAYLANQAASVGMFQHSMHDRMGAANLGKQGDDGRTSAAWVRVVRNQMDGTTGEGQLDAGTDTSALQIGGEIARGNDSRFHIGLMGGTGRADTDVTSTLLDWRAKGKVTGYNLGVYGTWFADAKAATGLYLDGWLQYGSYDNKVQGDLLASERYDSDTWAASIEAGYAFALNTGGTSRFYIEPQAQAIFTDYSASQHRENNGTLIDDVDAGGLTTRLGVRFYGHAASAEQNLVQPFVTFNWWHTDRNRMSFNDTALDLQLPRDRYEAKVGMQTQLSGGWTGWGNLGMAYGARDYHDVTGQLGLNYRW